MYVLAQMTSAIIILILLREVGIPHSRLTRIVQEREPFTWLVEDGPKLMPYLYPAHSRGRRLPVRYLPTTGRDALH